MYCPTIYKECPISVHLATQCLPRDSRPPPSDIMRFRDAPSHLSASLASTAQKTSGDNPSEPLALFILHNCGPPRYILPFISGTRSHCLRQWAQRHRPRHRRANWASKRLGKGSKPVSAVTSPGMASNQAAASGLGAGGMVPRPVHCGGAGPGRRETGQRHVGPPIRSTTAESHPHDGDFGAVLPHARRGQWVRREPMLHAGWLRRPAPEIVARHREWSTFGLARKINPQRAHQSSIVSRRKPPNRHRVASSSGVPQIPRARIRLFISSLSPRAPQIRVSVSRITPVFDRQ